MNDFSAGDAIGAGFKLVAREPLAVLAWAATYLVLGVLPQYALLATVPNILGFYQSQFKVIFDHAPMDLEAARAVSSHMMNVQPLMLIFSIISQTLIVGAILRAVLQPQDRRFAYLRLSGQELWLGLSGLVLGVVMVVLFVVVTLLVVIAGVIARTATGGGGGSTASGLIVVAIVVVGLLGMAWLYLRLSLAPAMSFAQGRFAFYESWSLTAGHALKMFGVLAAVLLILLVLEGALVAIGWSGLAAAGGGWRSFLTDAPDVLVRRLAPMFVVFVTIASVFGMVVYAILVAPWAVMYAGLSQGTEAADWKRL